MIFRRKLARINGEMMDLNECDHLNPFFHSLKLKWFVLPPHLRQNILYNPDCCTDYDLPQKRRKLRLFELNSVQNSTVANVADKVKVVSFRISAGRDKGSVKH